MFRLAGSYKLTKAVGLHREYHKWHSPSLGRDMELTVYGHAGLPAIVFPTSQGRFYEFEDRGMVAAIEHKINNGEVQLYCVDSVDAESWYNKSVGPDWRIARHVQYDNYIVHEVVPFLRNKNWNRQIASIGCSFGGFHAVNVAMKHPDIFTAFLSMSGAFDLSGFLGGYHDQNVYFNQPLQYLANMSDAWFLDRYRGSSYVLATGVHDQCWDFNVKLAHVMRSRGIPVRLDVWGDDTGHDWPYWHKMIQTYL
ncbi:esterase family protein [Granulicella tundricola]|uniref:esterase family protein n=1 Tax=Granulicella tundricola TaxID=940615 RepID=UPI002FC2CDAF